MYFKRSNSGNNLLIFFFNFKGKLSTFYIINIQWSDLVYILPFLWFLFPLQRYFNYPQLFKLFGPDCSYLGRQCLHKMVSYGLIHYLHIAHCVHLSSIIHNVHLFDIWGNCSSYHLMQHKLYNNITLHHCTCCAFVAISHGWSLSNTWSLCSWSKCALP